MAESLYPPHSRLFVVCDKEVTESEITNAFNVYGSIERVNLCRDRTSGNPKGFAFVQFEKTSEAAAAMEALNGRSIGHASRPLKVTVALSKDQTGSSGGGDISQFLRLFLVVPKTATENDLREYFSQFGSVDTVAIVKDRETKENKGYAYVKYKTFSDAARAFENCDRMYKVIFAKPKEHSGKRPTENMTAMPIPYAEPVVGCTHIDNNPEGFTCLQGVVSESLSDEQVEWLFDIPPGLQFVRFFNDSNYLGYESGYKRRVIAQYDSPGTAAYALRKLDGFEYPSRDRIIVKPDLQYLDRVPRMERQPSGPHTVSDLMKQVENLTKSLGEANRLIRSAGLGAPLEKSCGQLDAFRCSAKLPPPQPLAPSKSVAQERLFVVCEPGLPPHDALWDVFGRFGNLIDLYILNGKNCGYVKYADKGSAYRAMKTLNGEELYRMKLKVMIAEPKDVDRKRPRTNY